MNTQRRAPGLALSAALALLGGCGGEPALAPPEIHYGQAICDVCGMIVSDERFAAAEVVITDGRTAVTLFDDTGEIFDRPAPAAERSAWYVHDMRSLEWVEASRAVYLRSPELRTPMALHIAAFADQEGAARAQEQLGGDVLSFEQLRRYASER